MRNERIASRAAKPTESVPPPRLPIWGYRDPRAYLTDLTNAWKAADPSFSFRKLSQEADLGSPNYVQSFLKGSRQFKPDTARRVARALGLRRDESEFFLLLIRFADSEDESERRQWYRLLLETALRHGSGKIDSARLEYFSAWYIPVVHAMASLEGFVADPADIAARTVPAIRKNEAQRALEILATLQILTVDPESGACTLSEPSLETSPEIRAVWLREYHLAMLRIADSALDRWSRKERNVSSLTVTVASEQVRWLMGKIDTFRNELFAELLAGQTDMPKVRGEVFQINLQAFPVTSFTLSPLPRSAPATPPETSPEENRP